jgi:osmotically-inducible protein OsmY
MKTIVEKNDAEIKSDVLAELKYEPSVKVTDIGVLVKDGTVTLNGCASSYAEKWEAVRAAKRVGGVTAIADDITVKPWDSFVRTDADIATTAAHQIKWITSIPTGKVQITVSDGWITLDGELEWWFEKDEAERTIRALTVKSRLRRPEAKSPFGAQFTTIPSARKLYASPGQQPGYLRWMIASRSIGRMEWTISTLHLHQPR